MHGQYEVVIRTALIHEPPSSPPDCDAAWQAPIAGEMWKDCIFAGRKPCRGYWSEAEVRAVVARQSCTYFEGHAQTVGGIGKRRHASMLCGVRRVPVLPIGVRRNPPCCEHDRPLGSKMDWFSVLKTFHALDPTVLMYQTGANGVRAQLNSEGESTLNEHRNQCISSYSTRRSSKSGEVKAVTCKPQGRKEQRAR